MFAPSLARSGLSVQGALAVGALGDDVLEALVEGGHEPTGFASLLFFGQGGTALYERHVRPSRHRVDPFDETSVQLVRQWHSGEHPKARFEIVVPGTAVLPLGQLAEVIGWGRPSPLGLTINSTYGPWLAHRVVMLTEVEIEATTGELVNPCESCRDTPCVAACPVGAVSLTSGFDVETCARHRITPASPCELQCLARNACPVGAEHRYGPDQMNHHYGAGLASIRRWLEAEPGS